LTTKNTETAKIDFDPLSNRVLGCALEVHKTLGPGLLESAYERALIYELSSVGLMAERQTEVPVAYKEVKLDCGFRVDVLVEKQLILELKSVEKLLPVHEAQLLTYLKLTGCRVGLLINFNVPLLKNGIKRFVR
jgi:GxxExxY protein